MTSDASLSVPDPPPSGTWRKTRFTVGYAGKFCITIYLCSGPEYELSIIGDGVNVTLENEKGSGDRLVGGIKIHDEMQSLARHLSVKLDVDAERTRWMDRTLKNFNVIFFSHWCNLIFCFHPHSLTLSLCPKHYLVEIA